MVKMKIRYDMTLFFLVLIPLVSADTSFFDNPDDVFVMGSSSTGGVIGVTTGGGSCKYEWNCTNWGECFPSGKQTRNCTNIGTCSDTYKSPEIEQNCTYTNPESEKDKELENETEEPTFSPPDEKILDKNKIPVYFIIILIVSIILYLKKDYLKKLIKK